jgi:predicted nucleic acid-binding protein
VYTLDTNAIIYQLKEDPEAVPLLRDILATDGPFYISAITEIELFRFSRLDDDEKDRIEDLLDTVTSIPVDSRLARIAGMLGRDYGLKVADGAIAATALLTGTTLVTRNTNDFKRVTHLKLLRI